MKFAMDTCDPGGRPVGLTTKGEQHAHLAKKAYPAQGCEGTPEVDKKDDVKVLPQHGVRPGVGAAAEPFLQLRSVLLDYLHPVWRYQLARPGNLRRRRHRYRHRLAARLLRLCWCSRWRCRRSASPTRRRVGSITGVPSSGNRGTGWVTAWLNLLGLITVLGAINVGTWTFFVGAFGRDARHREQPHQSDDLPDHHHRRRRPLSTTSAFRLTAMLTDFSGCADLRRLHLSSPIVCLIAAEPGISAGSSPSPTIPASRAAMSGRRSPT